MPPSAENVLSSFLGRAGSTYRHPDQTKRDVQSLLHHYKGLTPKPDKFMFNDGRERELLHLQGTIPVPYKGNIKYQVRWSYLALQLDATREKKQMIFGGATIESDLISLLCRN